MDLKLSEEERLIRDTAAQFVHREMLTREADYLRQPELFLPPGDPPRRDLNPEIHGLLKKIAGRIGIWALELSTSRDGPPVSAVARVLVHREFGRSVLPFAPPAMPALMATTPYADDLVGGNISLCLAFDEIHKTGDLTELRTRFSAAGAASLIGAARLEVLDPGADLFLLPAREEKSGTVALFVLPANLPGAAVKDLEDLTSDGAAAVLTLDGCRLAKGQVVGGEAEIAAIIASEQLHMAGRCLGIGMRCLEDAIEHARVRVTFGRPLAQRQAIQWMLADLSTDIAAATWLTLEAAWRADNGMRYWEAAALAKTRAAKMAFRAADTAIQIHGGYGVCKEFPFEGFYREARLLRLLYGREAEMDRSAGKRFIASAGVD